MVSEKNIEEEIYKGAGIDERPEEQKEKDWTDDMVRASAPPIEWKEKDIRRYFSKRNQRSSLSCMAQSGVKMSGIDNFVETGNFLDFSAMPIYRDRPNYPSGGMSLFSLLSGMTKPRVVLEADLKSQDLTESEMNNLPISFTEKMKQDAIKYNAKGYVQFPIVLQDGKVKTPVNIDKVAEIIESGKGVELILFFTSLEYWNKKPKINNHDLRYNDEETSRHGVCAVDYFIEDGEKCLLIEDSAGNNSSIDKKGQRVLTETFFNERCYGAGYLIDKENVLQTAPKLLITLRKGSTGEQVKVLQKMLGGLVVDGIFGLKTETAVRQFQITHGLVSDGIVGAKTRAVLNNL